MLWVLMISLVAAPVWYVTVRQLTPPRPLNAAWSSRVGWFGVTLATLISSFMAMFAGGETAAEGIIGIGHVVWVAILVTLALVSLSVRGFGAVYAVPGAGFIIAFPDFFSVVIGLFLIGAGVAFWIGEPKPQALAYRIAWLVPVFIAIFTALLVLVIGEKSAI